MRRVILAIVVCCRLIGGGAAALGLWAYRQFEAPGPASADIQVVIPKGAGASGIAERLAGIGVVADSLIFKLGTRVFGQGRPLRAGESLFTAHASARKGGGSTSRRARVCTYG